MQGRAQVFDHCFTWRTEFDLSWSEAWDKNQKGQAQERNIVLVIPGRNRAQAVIMADHYDTAYMEDVFEPARGGDGLRAAAAGADDNHSATATLLAAAEVFLPLARAGRLERDIWLVHLTGEEFPSDCLGARALAQALVERSLRLTAEDGSTWDASAVRVVGAFVLDMIGHNNNHDRDVFQIASGEGAGSARLALCAHLANQRWNRQAQKRTPPRRDGAWAAPNACPTARSCRRLSPICPSPARCGSNGSRARPCTTPTARSSRTWAYRSCSSWRTTTSTAPGTTTPMTP